MFWQLQPHFLPAAPSVVTLKQLFQIMWKQATDESLSSNHYLTRSNVLIAKQNWKVWMLEYFSYFFLACFWWG